MSKKIQNSCLQSRSKKEDDKSNYIADIYKIFITRYKWHIDILTNNNKNETQIYITVG